MIQDYQDYQDYNYYLGFKDGINAKPLGWLNKYYQQGWKAGTERLNELESRDRTPEDNS